MSKKVKVSKNAQNNEETGCGICKTITNYKKVLWQKKTNHFWLIYLREKS